MKRLIEMLERAYELGMQAQNNEVDIALAEEVTSESAEMLAMLNDDWSAFESEEVMDAELLKLTKVIHSNDYDGEEMISTVKWINAEIEKLNEGSKK
jgi:hypothetical protein